MPMGDDIVSQTLLAITDEQPDSCSSWRPSQTLRGALPS